jgi:hypothetical protein
MPEDKLIDPGWLIQARRRRKMFVARLAVVFLLLTVLAWWILPTFRDRVAEIQRSMPTRRGKEKAEEPPLAVSLLLTGVGAFKVFWVGIAVGCGAAALLALTGRIDSLVPVLNWALLAVGLATVGVTFYVFYLPTLSMLRSVG